ncbi:MAG: hypothetical protein KY445_12925 [Armatimonadetes bacterium]|nr:hypothetical protein [Armatimonadota bacterium]
MSKVQHNLWLNVAAFLLPLFAGYLALAADPFLFLALFFISAFASLSHPSVQVKAAARVSLLGFIFGFVSLFIILVNSDLG